MSWTQNFCCILSWEISPDGQFLISTPRMSSFFILYRERVFIAWPLNEWPDRRCFWKLIPNWRIAKVRLVTFLRADLLQVNPNECRWKRFWNSTVTPVSHPVSDTCHPHNSKVCIFVFMKFNHETGNFEQSPYDWAPRSKTLRVVSSPVLTITSTIFYRTQVYLRSDLWVRVSLTNSFYLLQT